MISIIVCAHNESENLRELAPLLKNQDYTNLEVIFVLDRCTDKSHNVLEHYENDQFRILILENHPDHIHPKKYGISQAIDMAKGEWMLLTDADCRPTVKWASAMSKGMEPEKDLLLGISPYSRKNGFLNLLIQYETYITALHFISAALKGEAYMGLGRNLAYRKSAFLAKEGFGPDAGRMGGDDDLLVQRLANGSNVGIVLTQDAKVDSIPQQSWSSFVKQKTRHFSVSNAYLQKAKSTETSRWVVHILFWLFFSLSLFIYWQLTVLFFVGSFLMKAISINIVADRLEKRFSDLWLPVMDLAYVVLLPLISLRSLLVKRITWK